MHSIYNTIMLNLMYVFSSCFFLVCCLVIVFEDLPSPCLILPLLSRPLPPPLLYTKLTYTLCSGSHNFVLTTCPTANIFTFFSFLQYLNAIWNVINFEEAERRFLDASK